MYVIHVLLNMVLPRRIVNGYWSGLLWPLDKIPPHEYTIIFPLWHTALHFWQLQLTFLCDCSFCHPPTIYGWPGYAGLCRQPQTWNWGVAGECDGADTGTAVMCRGRRGRGTWAGHPLQPQLCVLHSFPHFESSLDSRINSLWWRMSIASLPTHFLHIIKFT